MVFAKNGGKVMYVIAEIAGRQVQLEEGAKLRIPLMDAAAGDKLNIDRVLALVDGAKSNFGAPHIEGVTVEATVIEHGRAAKVINFRMKRRKGYRRKRGHRQQYTLISVGSITA
jgi:large subunit ribosomal protein L21